MGLDSTALDLYQEGMQHSTASLLSTTPPSGPCTRCCWNSSWKSISSSPSSGNTKTLFLIALATGMWSSQLRAHTRYFKWMFFYSLTFRVILSPSPKHLAKTERADHMVQPITVPACSVSGVLHLLCPVDNPHIYLKNTVDASKPQESLFEWHDSLKPCSTYTALSCEGKRQSRPWQTAQITRDT